MRPSRYSKLPFTLSLAFAGLGALGCNQQGDLQLAGGSLSAGNGGGLFRPVSYGGSAASGGARRAPFGRPRAGSTGTRDWRDVLGFGGGSGSDLEDGLGTSEESTVPQELQGRAFRVKASTFGDQETAKPSADNPDNYLSYGERCVALPADAVGRWVVIAANDNKVYAPVCDKGPWRTSDPYWETGQRPWAERNVGKKMCGGLDGGQRSCNIHVNGAAIDLSWQTWADLMGGEESDAKNDGGMVEWAFVERDEGLAWVQQKEGGATMLAYFPTEPSQLQGRSPRA